MKAPALSAVAVLAGAMTLLCFATEASVAGDYAMAGGMIGVGGGNRCAAFGPDYAAVEGSDTCVRIGGHVRVELGPANARLDPTRGWTAGHASAATLRVEGADLNATSAMSHLRVHGGLEYPDPFR